MNAELQKAFSRQASACAGLGSGFTAQLMELLPGLLPNAPRLLARLDAWPEAPGPEGASLPLRLAGGLHALVRAGQAQDLAAQYPPNPGECLEAPLARVLAEHEDWLDSWIESPPQTNEVGRSAVLIPVARALAERFGLPLRLSELGASAGLNLRFDAFRLRAGEKLIGTASTVLLTPDWRGRALAEGPDPKVIDRRGVDLAPVDPCRDADRLMAYVWPDQTERLRRLEAALDLATRIPAPVDRGDAADWLEARLADPGAGSCHMVFHTVAHQYFPKTTQDRIRAAMEQAGAAATATAPLAWVGMESDGGLEGAGITLRLWPGDLRADLGRAGFHGQWVDWRGLD